MKFVIAVVVMLAVVMAVQSSLIAGLPGLGLASHGPLLAQGPQLLGWGHGLSAAIHTAPAHIPAAWAVAPQIAAIPAHSATYVAKTRGAIHTAPLPGHLQSAASVNLAPAPGTW